MSVEEGNKRSGQRPLEINCANYAIQCNREWPCNVCQKRRVPDRCSFGKVRKADERKPAPSAVQKRSGLAGDRNDGDDDDDNDFEDVAETDLDSDHDRFGLEAMGYMAGPLLSSLEVAVKVRLYDHEQVMRQLLTRHRAPPSLSRNCIGWCRKRAWSCDGHLQPSQHDYRLVSQRLQPADRSALMLYRYAHPVLLR